MKTTVVVLGASGQVGLFTIARLLEDGFPVIAVRREPVAGSHSAIDGLEVCGQQNIVDRMRPELGGGERRFSLLSCGPVRLALDLLSTSATDSETPWDRVVVTGTTSIRTKESSTDAGESGLVGEIRSVCDEIGVFCQQHDLPLCVLHPTLIYGCGMDQNLSRVYRWIQKAGIVPVARQSGGLRQPLHVADLADALVSCVKAQPALTLESPVCGAGQTPYDEMISLVFKAAGRQRRLLRLPAPLIPPLVAMYRLFSGNQQLNREMFRRQARDMIFDDSAARELLGHDPRPFAPGERDFCLPDSISQIREALL